MAGPSVLGISSGAGLGVALVVLWAASGGVAPALSKDWDYPERRPW
jgi:ABC-type Fe3+-siderophore transport system permease subunit